MIYIGYRLNKPLAEDVLSVQNPDGTMSYTTNEVENTVSNYEKMARWCGENEAYVKEFEGYYEVCNIPEPTTEQIASAIRYERDAKLSATDYLVFPDYPISPEDLKDVKVYRQALRSIPEQSGFPKNVQWPVEPQFLSAKKKEGSIGLAKVGL